MITYNMTAGNDNELIWLVRVNLDDVTFRFSDVNGGISLDGNTWDAAVMDWEQWRQTQLDKAIDLTGGGSLGSIGNFEFAIQRYNAFTGLSDYFEDVYPATGARYLTSRIIEIGYVWSGATSESEITWEAKYYIRKFPYTDSRMTLICFEINDLVNKELPYYKVQKDYDDGISYFTNAVDSDYDKHIPILYGDFAPTQQPEVWQSITAGNNFSRFTPSLIINQTKSTFMVASHPCYAVGNIDENSDYYSFRYLDNVDAYLRLSVETSGTTSGVNTEAGHYYTMQNSGASKLLGQVVIQLVMVGSQSGITSAENIADLDNTSYNEIDAGEKVSLLTKGSVNSSELGILATSINDIQTIFQLSSNAVSNRDYKVAFYYERNGSALTSSTTNETGTLVNTNVVNVFHTYGDTNKIDVGDVEQSRPYEPSDLCSREYYAENTEAGAGDKIRVYGAFLFWKNINVLAIARNQKLVTSNRNAGDR